MQAVASETELETLCDLLVDAAFLEGTVHLVEGELAFTCEIMRAVPDKAEEYWMGPVHRTRIPWTKCLIEFTGLTRCQTRELEHPSPEGEPLLSWQKHGGQYLVRLHTPFHVELVLTLPRIAGRYEDMGQLIWQR